MTRKEKTAFEKQHIIGQKKRFYECWITRDQIKRHENDLKWSDRSNWSDLIECLLAFKWKMKTKEKNDVFDFFTFLKGVSV